MRSAHRSILSLVLLSAVWACEPDADRALTTAPRAATNASVGALAVAAALPTEADALAISATIQQRHLPYGVMADPHFGSADPASADYTTIVGYDHAGDGAIWTGPYLAAEAFRYAVTSSPNALRNVRRAVKGIKGLVDVTGTSTVPDELARFSVPQTSPYAQQITTSESRHGIHPGTVNGEAMYWIDNVSRDQYSGVFFGLAVAYDLVPDAQVRQQISKLVTRMLNFLSATAGMSRDQTAATVRRSCSARTSSSLSCRLDGTSTRRGLHFSTRPSVRHTERRSPLPS